MSSTDGNAARGQVGRPSPTSGQSKAIGNPATSDLEPVRQRAEAAPPETPRRGAAPGLAEGPSAPDAIGVGTGEGTSNAGRPPAPPPAQRHRSLADLLQVADSATEFIPGLPRLEIDEARVSRAGIRKVSGTRLTLFTDLAASEAVDELPHAFDAAFSQWCAYFGLDAADHPDWAMTGFIMGDKNLFLDNGLLPPDLPPFQHGFSRNYELWLYEQPSDYYRRHLLLHEGTHGFMNTMLGGCGPPWYMEGVAELLATHRWEEGRLTLGYVPKSHEEVPRWGRIRMIQEAYAAGRGMLLKDVVAYDIRAHLEVEPYAWCWAAALLLDRHPRYRDRFRQLQALVLAHDFNRQFYQLVGSDWENLAEQWQILAAGMEFGYDVGRTAVDFTPGMPLQGTSAEVTVDTARAWQNSGIQLESGKEYRLRASGRYQVDDQPQIWWCEPNGVSIRYYQGQPLGILLAAVRPERPGKALSALLSPSIVGMETTLMPEETGTLFLRINDSAGELDDNAGTLTVEVVPVE